MLLLLLLVVASDVKTPGSLLFFAVNFRAVVVTVVKRARARALETGSKKEFEHRHSMSLLLKGGWLNRMLRLMIKARSSVVSCC